ncbi:hypothetical protein P154DRAFT_624896 [Amniculicola lignicola CBS 123094]|uniref:Uncharacterized protein n=1 Tax=Amniculicola lignicola CBS 123094 TaxID=1392246 RepID=A0A6A5W231_9PLEO|nr:hypothetical protein P154DRAFT_624896 [Amniculicola lignicola CBS 123094]
MLEPAASTLSVGHVAAMSDMALGEFIQRHRDPDDNIVLPVDGWDALSKDERARLAERLKAQQRALAQSPTTHSQPLDLDQLDARLRDVSKDDPSQAQRRRLPNGESRSPTPFFDREAVAREHETEAYNNLVKNGSRPLYLIVLLDKISQRPEEYSELLQPWKERFGSTGRHWAFAYGFPTGYGPLDSDDASGDSWEVFQRQWARWQNFRIWQRDNRWIEDDDDGFPIYVEWCKDCLKRYPGVGRDVAKKLAKLADIESDPSILKDEGWNRALWNRREQQRLCREQHGGVEFADYVNAVKRRLARHGFTRPFELKEDPKQQDDLSTWIEYLGFEYWWLDRYTDTIDRLKPSYNKAWQMLVDSKVLRPHETQEYVPTDECAMRDDAEYHQAWDALKRARKHAEQVYTSTQLDSNRLSIPKAERCQRLKTASQKLRTANAWVSSTEKRNKLIREYVLGTWSTRTAKKDAARHRTLLAWILEQIPLIETELGQTTFIGFA